MHLPDMPKRMVPFPLVLVAITGVFILVALYADVRGRERRAAETPPVNIPDVGVENFQPLPDESATSTPDEGGITPPLQPVSEPLGLLPETPTSDVPAAAVFDCWRFEWRGDRLIVDRDYRHIAGDGIEPMVGPDTAHLRCKAPQYALSTEDGVIKMFWSGRRSEPNRPTNIENDVLYAADPYDGQLTRVAVLDHLDDLTDYALSTFDADLLAVWLRADSSKSRVTTLYHITVDGEIRSYEYPQIWSPLELTPDRTRAIGFEYTSHGDLPEGSPVYLHRINLATGVRVRTKPLSGVFDGMISETNWRPVFIDNERLIMPGKGGGGIASGAVVVNVFTGATARVPQLSGTIELFALTKDGSTFYTFSDEMPLTAIPVSELPKP